MGIIASIIFLMTYEPKQRILIDPCNNITTLELAMGCSTVYGKRVYSETRLEELSRHDG